MTEYGMTGYGHCRVRVLPVRVHPGMYTAVAIAEDVDMPYYAVFEPSAVLTGEVVLGVTPRTTKFAEIRLLTLYAFGSSNDGQRELACNSEH